MVEEYMAKKRVEKSNKPVIVIAVIAIVILALVVLASTIYESEDSDNEVDDQYEFFESGVLQGNVIVTVVDEGNSQGDTT
jgi:hypothetical protein